MFATKPTACVPPSVLFVFFGLMAGTAGCTGSLSEGVADAHPVEASDAGRGESPDACTPRSCEAGEWGWVPDGCGGLLDCDAEHHPSDTPTVYVDFVFETEEQDGSRERPFLSLADGLYAAAVRGVSRVVVARSPEIRNVPRIPDGISIVGGFTGWPAWVPDASQRPVFRATADDVEKGRLVGLMAEDIHEPTVLEHVRIETADLGGEGSESNIGLLARNAAHLELRDVEIEVGAAASGAPGASGEEPAAEVTPAGRGGAGQQMNSDGRCDTERVEGGNPGQVRCHGELIEAARGGEGGSSTGAERNPPDWCNTDTLSCYFARGEDSPGGAAGGQTTRDPVNRQPGADGAERTGVAESGADGQAGIELVAGLPVLTGVGQDGMSGAPGNGGGGGSTGQVSRTTNTEGCTVGGGGGGGGHGGCGGAHGQGGQPGGWSVGILAVGEPGTEMEDVQILLGRPGRGGEGGEGTPGTAGGSGSGGGTGHQGSNTQLTNGTRGGRGSAGQTGGDGGRGADGLAVGMLCDTPRSLDGLEVQPSEEEAPFERGWDCE